MHRSSCMGCPEDHLRQLSRRRGLPGTGGAQLYGTLNWSNSEVDAATTILTPDTWTWVPVLLVTYREELFG